MIFLFAGVLIIWVGILAYVSKIFHDQKKIKLQLEKMKIN
ncbi:CcmD family protein [Cytobacillus firmus]